MLVVTAAYIAIYTVAALIARVIVVSCSIPQQIRQVLSCRRVCKAHSLTLHSGLASLEPPNLGYLAA